MWGKREVIQDIKVVSVIDPEEVDAAVSRLEEATKKADTARSNLLQTISEAKRAKGELESVLAKARRQGRGM